MAMPGRPNAEQLRARIDRGETKDKVRGGDPAAAPLGSDEEAAGTPPTPEEIAAAAHAELTRQNLQGRDRASTFVLVLAVILTVLAGLAAILLGRP